MKVMYMYVAMSFPTQVSPTDGPCTVTCITCTSSNDLVYIDIHHSLQDGDSAVIRATLLHRSGALHLLVDSGADLNLHNEVRYKVTMDTTLHHVLFLSIHTRRV